MGKIYTIGHSVHSVDFFLKLINKFSINCVIDVRSNPFSRYAPQYNISEIKKTLSSYGIYYIFMGKEFGARRTESELYDSDGLLNFEKVIRSNLFQSGMKRVKEGLDKGFNITFMCTEKDPLDCHRSILVGRAFYDENYEVLNLTENGSIQSQEELTEKLLNNYFPNRKQSTIFDILEEGNKEEDLVREAYLRRNKEIAYKLEEKEAEIV